MSTEEDSVKAPRRNVSFEVAVRRMRRWEVHATYSAVERAAALADARALEKETLVDGTKVTKETWWQETNRVDTAVIYRSPALEREMIALAASRPKPTGRKPVGLGARFAAHMTGASATKTTGKARESVVADVSLGRVLPWILLSFIGACIVGAGAAVLASIGMQTAIEDGTPITRQEQSGILIGTFLAITGLVFFIALRRILAKFARDRRIRQEVAIREATPATAPAGASTTATRPAEPKRTEVPNAALPAPPVATAGVGDAPVLHPDAEAEPEGRRGVILSPDDAATAVRAGKPLNETIQAFETVLRGRLTGRMDEFDASQRFALNVYIAGAVERLAQNAGSGRDARHKLLTAPLIRLGTPPEIAARFGQTLDEHLTRPRALEVFNRGRDAAALFADDDSDAIDPLSAIAAWDMPVSEDEEQANGIVAIMFTDIVESTAHTHAAGDQAGVAIVRAHNAIVRDALKRCDGTEIKHTGDGIMASFAVAGQAAEAARLIQRNAAAFSKTDPATAFMLRIGINVGEPVRENDDLFGSAVQLAARLCAAGKAGQTIVSRVVRDLCTGKTFAFDDLGSVELKGIPGRTELHALRWQTNDASQAAVAAE